MSWIFLRSGSGVIPFASLWAICLARRRSVSLDRVAHGRGHLVRVHVDLAGDVAGRAADRLDQRAAAAQEALLVGVEDRHQRHLGQVEALPEQVDADQHVVVALAQLLEQLDAAQRVDLGVQVADPDAVLQQVVGQVLGHLLGQRGDQDPLVLLRAQLDLVHQVVDLALGRLHHHLRVDQAGRADDLLDELALGLPHLPRARGRGQEHHLPDPLEELVETQRPVVGGAGQPEAVLDQDALAGGVALVHAADLRDRHVRLVDHGHEVVREVVQQGVGRVAVASGRPCAWSSSRCRCRSRPGASSRCRRWCASAAAAPRAACPGAPARRAARPARPRCRGSPAPSAPGRPRSGSPGR